MLSAGIHREAVAVEGSSAKMRIRDHMDDILEARGYYRKHVARESGSVFRAVADVLFHTQQHVAKTLQYCLGVYRMTRGKEGADEEDGVEDGDDADRLRRHRDLCDLADLLRVSVEVLETSDPDISTLRIEPRDPGGGRRPPCIRRPLLACEDCAPSSIRAADPVRRSTGGVGQAGRPLLLCFTNPTQYDPVFPKSSIDDAAMVQSVLYEMLYVKVFGVEDAMEAADLMLNGSFDPMYGKPEVYDRDFEGTAMEALNNFLIPFPYKVAKALDPEIYRLHYFQWLSCLQIFKVKFFQKH